MLTNVNLKGNANLKTIILWDECTATCNDYLHHDMNTTIQVVDNNGGAYGYPYYIGQFIPYRGGHIVYEVNNNGSNAKLLTIHEGTSQNSTDAINWCDNYGEGVRIPKSSELDVINNLKSYINNKLIEHNFTQLTNLYWCSYNGGIWRLDIDTGNLRAGGGIIGNTRGILIIE
jgi:hypothetical protein